MALPEALEAERRLMSDELTRRRPVISLLDRYAAGFPDGPDPSSPVRAKSREYMALMRQSATNWPKLIVDSVEERLEVIGFRFGSTQADEDAWAIWQQNNLDGEASLVHQAALISGRAFVLVWPVDGEARIVPEHASHMVVRYDPLSGEPVAALREWQTPDGGTEAAIYHPDEVIRLTMPKSGTDFEEKGRAENPLAPQIPVVEFSLNRTLGGFGLGDDAGNYTAYSRDFGSAHGEFEPFLPQIDRINTSMFEALLKQRFASFPIRALIGEPIEWERDENGDVKLDAAGNPVARTPIDGLTADRLLHLENPEAKLIQLPEGDVGNSLELVRSDIEWLSAVSKTPPLLGQIVNVSADAIRMNFAGLVAKIRRHHRTLGERWEEVMRLAFRARDSSDPRASLTDAEALWRDPEIQSLAEQADAAVKLATIMPWQAIAERILNATPQEIARWQSQRAADGLGLLSEQAPPEPATVEEELGDLIGATNGQP